MNYHIYPTTTTGKVTAVASQTLARAQEFADAFETIPSSSAYSNYEKVMTDPNVDVVYIATLADQHAALAIQSLQHGKPTVVEKPVTLSYQETHELIETADTQKVFFMYVLFSSSLLLLLCFFFGFGFGRNIDGRA